MMNLSKRTYLLSVLLIVGGTLSAVKGKKPNVFFKTAKPNLFKTGKRFQVNKYHPTNVHSSKNTRLLQTDEEKAQELCDSYEDDTEELESVQDVDCVTCNSTHIECDIIFKDDCLYSDQQQKEICYNDEIDVVVDDPLSDDPVVELDGYIEYEGDLNGTTLTMKYTLPFMDYDTWELKGGSCTFTWNNETCNSCQVGCDGAYGFSLDCSNIDPCAVTECEISMEVIPHDLIVFIADIEAMDQNNRTTCPPPPGVDYVAELCDQYQENLEDSFEDVMNTSCPICTEAQIQCEADTEEECVKDEQGQMTDVCFTSEVDIDVDDPTRKVDPPLQEIDFLIHYTRDLEGHELDLNYTQKADQNDSSSINDDDYDYKCSVAWNNVNCTSCQVEDDYDGITLDCSNVHRCAVLDMVDIFDDSTSYIISPQFITFMADLVRMDDNDLCPPLSAVPVYEQRCGILENRMKETFQDASCSNCTEDEIGCKAVGEEVCVKNEAQKDVCYTAEMSYATEYPTDATPAHEIDFFIQYTQGNNVMLHYEPVCSIEWNNETCTSCFVGCNGTQDGITIDCSNIYPDAFPECQEGIGPSYSLSSTLITFFAKYMDTTNESDDVSIRSQKAARAYGVLFTLLLVVFNALLWIYCHRRCRRDRREEESPEDVVVWDPSLDIHNQGQMA